ncbi:MAG: HAD family hydrolase [Alphaproteobacteria bacterium]
MENKTEVSLVVSDVANTVVDFFGNWGTSTKKAFEDLAASRKITMDSLVEDVMANTSSESRMYDLATMIKMSPILQPKNDEEKANFAKDDAKIIHEWQKKRDDNTFYEGVIDSVREVKSKGCKFVFYSDSPISSVVARLAQGNFPADLIDGIYAQPDLPNASEVPMEIASKVNQYKKLLGDKVRPLYNCPNKPHPVALKKIMKDMKVENPKQAVMVGDSLRSDCGGGNAAGMNTAWQKQGADVCKEAVDFYFTIPMKPNYVLGLERSLKQLSEHPEYKPSVVLEKGYRDLNKHFEFVSADKNKSSEKTVLNAQVMNKLLAKQR